jgi:hypothetical protein
MSEDVPPNDWAGSRPKEIHQALIEMFKELRSSTQTNLDTIKKLIAGMGPRDPSWNSAQDLHRQLSNAIATLDTAIDRLRREQHVDPEIDLGE